MHMHLKRDRRMTIRGRPLQLPVLVPTRAHLCGSSLLLTPSLRVQIQRLAMARISPSQNPRPSLENQRELIERTEEFFWTVDQPPPPHNTRLIDAA